MQGLEEEKLVESVLLEDERRMRERSVRYDPVEGSLSPGSRFRLEVPGLEPEAVHVPVAMQQEREVRRLMAGDPLTEVFPGSMENARRRWHLLRCRYDFPYWAFKCIKLKMKEGGGLDIPFVLRAPQRKLVGEFEKMREAGLPIRIVLVKARQWGGSTATQLYMLWIQLMRRKGFNSLIVGHQNSSTDEVIMMAKTALDSYPRDLLVDEGDDPMPEKEKVYTGVGLSRCSISIPRRNFRIKAGSAERPDSSRGGDYALVHLTEVGLWKKTLGKSPEDIIRAATSGVLLRPETMIVMESTANGVGNFFNNEYEAARRGSSLYRPVFVAWYEIEDYTKEVPDRRAFAEQIVRYRHSAFSDDNRFATGRYIWELWEAGATLDALRWYIDTRAGYSNPDQMLSEFPSNDVEAFVNSGAHVFNRSKALRLRKRCIPARWRGELTGRGDSGEKALEGISFEEEPKGRLKVWDMPDVDGEGREREVYNRYLTVVDVGGRSIKADWSVIAVFDRIRMVNGGGPSVAAQWRGHCDMDELAWLAARVARWYGDSLLVIESNTLETRDPDRYVDGDQSMFLLNQLRNVYGNLYARKQSPEDIVEGRPRKYGFHTNVSTKPMIISNLVRVVRENLYIERDEGCIDEFLTYERRPNGSYGAVTGKHDDMLMTRAIGLHICFNEMTRPVQRGGEGERPPLMRSVVQQSLF